MMDAIFILYGAQELTYHAIVNLRGTCFPTPLRLHLIDHSPDPLSSERLAGWLAPEDTYERDPSNPGVATALNRVLARTRSEKVILASSDAFPALPWLRVCLKAMEQMNWAWVGPAEASGPFAPGFGWEACGHDGRYTCLPQLASSTAILDWPRLQREVGLFDERFFITFQDTDYAERMLAAGVGFGAVYPALSNHLVQQSRLDLSAEENVRIEMADEARFREKWQDHPEVLARHQFSTRTAEERAAWRQQHYVKQGVAL